MNSKHDCDLNALKSNVYRIEPMALRMCRPVNRTHCLRHFAVALRR